MSVTFTFTPRAQAQWSALAPELQEAGRRLLRAVQLAPAAGAIVERTPAGQLIRRVSGPRLHVFYIWFRSGSRVAVVDILDIAWESADPDNDTGER